MKPNAYYDDWKMRCALHLEPEDIQRLKIVHERWTNYNIVVADVKTKVQEVLNSDFIFLVN